MCAEYAFQELFIELLGRRWLVRHDPWYILKLPPLALLGLSRVRYIIAATANGVWAGWDGNIAGFTFGCRHNRNPDRRCMMLAITGNGQGFTTGGPFVDPHFANVILLTSFDGANGDIAAVDDSPLGLGLSAGFGFS